MFFPNQHDKGRPSGPAARLFEPELYERHHRRAILCAFSCGYAD